MGFNVRARTLLLLVAVTCILPLFTALVGVLPLNFSETLGMVLLLAGAGATLLWLFCLCCCGGLMLSGVRRRWWPEDSERGPVDASTLRRTKLLTKLALHGATSAVLKKKEGDGDGKPPPPPACSRRRRAARSSC